MGPWWPVPADAGCCDTDHPVARHLLAFSWPHSWEQFGFCHTGTTCHWCVGISGALSSNAFVQQGGPQAHVFFPPKSEGSGQVSSALQFLTRLVQT